MEKTNQEIWEEIQRLVQTMKAHTPAIEQMQRAAMGLTPPSAECLTIHYVSDAEVLLHLLDTLRSRGASFE